jgi:expansin (peptidoglycan-binding protein)
MLPRSIFTDKYTTWCNITDENYDEIVGTAAERTLQIRVADHSLRCGNLEKGMADVVLSFVTTEDNATAGRFGFDYLLEWSIAGMTDDQANAFIASKVREHFGPVMSEQARNGSYINYLEC